MKIIWIFFVFLLNKLSLALKSEYLELYPLNSASRNLLHFSFNYEEKIDLDSIISINSILHRSIYDVFLIENNAYIWRMSSANGRVNPFLIENLSFDFEFPEPGTQVYMNSDANYKKTIFSLNELFNIETRTLIKEDRIDVDFQSISNNNKEISNSYDNFNSKSFQFSNSNKFIYGNSPNDFICVDTLEKIKNLLLCNGERGVYSILDLNNIFNSEYSSISSNFYYNNITKIAKFDIKLIFIIDIDIKNPYFYFQQQNLESCPHYEISQIKILQNNEENKEKLFDLKEINKIPIQYFTLIKNKSEKTLNECELIIKKYVTKPVYLSEAEIVYELKNPCPQNANFIIHEYLPFYFHLKSSQIKTYQNNSLNKFDYDLSVSKNIENNNKILKIISKINPFKSLIFSIPIKKLMKSFDTYPHDPARGHSLINIPILYRFTNEKIIRTTNNNNLLIRIPEPDFSMPFNIATFTFVALGYFYLSIFKIIFMKNYEHWLFQNESKGLLKFI